MPSYSREDANTEFSYTYSVDSMRQHEYGCTECGQTAKNSILNVQHESDCPATTPDEVALPLTQQSERQVRNLIQYGFELLDYEDPEYAQELQPYFEEKDGVRWVATGSTSRIVLGLGRTNVEGAFHHSSHRNIVLKFEPGVRTRENTPKNGNVSELQRWRRAGETGTRLFFGEMLAASRDGAWLLMEGTIPIHPIKRREMGERDLLYDKDREKHIKPLLAALHVHGWLEVDAKHGNIGLTDNGNPVLIDYGTGPNFRPEEVRESEVFPEVVENIDADSYPPQFEWLAGENPDNTTE
jgi:hypothetical protein